MMTRYRISVLLAFAVLLLCATSPVVCRSLEESVERYFETGSEPEIYLKSFNGDILVRSGSSNGVRVRLTKHVYRLTGLGAEHALDSIEVKMEQDGNRITIQANGPHHRMFFKCTGSILEVEVPSGSRVFAETSSASIETEGLSVFQSLKTSDGHIYVEEARGNVEVEASNGPLEIELEDGSFEGRTSNAKVEIESRNSDIDVSSSNGPIDIEMDGGTVRARTSSGKVEIEGHTERADIETSNGRIRLDLGHSPVQVHAVTSNGGINFEGSPTGTSLLKTSNGPIRADIPDDLELWIEAATSNGPIKSDIRFDYVQEQREARLIGRVGEKPETRLILETSNGPIDIDLN